MKGEYTMWKEIVIFAILMAIAAVGIWINLKILDGLVAQPPELDEEEEN
jgi:hypothetical protein